MKKTVPQKNNQTVQRQRSLRHPRKTVESQRGVTLLLALMILAAVSAVVFSISVIALNEVKTSADEINSEPAITGAEALAEDMLYTNIRGLATSCSGNPQSATLPESGVATTFENSYYYPGTYNVSVPANSNLPLYLYNPCSPGATPYYTSVTVQLGSGSGSVSVCTWNNSNCQASPDVDGYQLSAGNSSTTDLSDMIQYQIILSNTSNSSESFGLTTTSDNSAVTGIPAPNITIITTGSLGGVTRKLQTLLPPSY